MGQRSTSILTNFSSGEVSPRLAARLDLAQYQNSCRTVQNGIVTVQGGVEKRPGSYYVGTVADSSKKTYLFSFRYSAEQQYVLEFGNCYIRFYYEHALVVSADVVTPYLTAEIPSLKMRQSGDIIYIAHPNHPPAKLSRYATGWVYEVITFQMGSHPVRSVSAGQAGCVRVSVINHGFASNNAVYISGVNGVPQANGIFIINVIDVDTFDLIGSSLPGVAVSGISPLGQAIVVGTPGLVVNTGDYVNIGGVQGTTEANGTWKVTVLDALPNIQLDNSAYVNNYISGGWASLASSYGYTSGGSATLILPITGAANNGSGEIRITSSDHGFLTGQGVNVTQVLGTTEANAIWEISVIDENTYDLNGSTFTHAYTSGGYGIPVTFATANNYPSTVAFFEQRLVWGASLNQPQSLWFSHTGSFENLITGTNDDDAIFYSLNSDGVNTTRWMASWNVLLLGTVDGEWRFGGATITDPVTPTSALAKIQSKKGSADIEALLIGDLVIFVQYYGKKIYQIGYTFVSDSFSSAELTKLASHITSPGIIAMAAQEAPECVVWFVRSDGVLVSMTFYTDEKIIAFSRHITDGLYESVTSVKGETEDEIWVIVNRDGVRCIEYFMPRDFTAGESGLRPYPYFFVDCGLTFDGGDPVTITNSTRTNPVVITYSGNNPTNGWTIRPESVGGMTDINNNVYTVAGVNTSDKTFQLSGVDGSSFDAYTTGGTWRRVVSTVTGLGHLFGKEVDICADGYALESQVVSGASLSLGEYYNRISVGLHYDFILEPQSIEINTMQGTSAGTTKRIEKLMLRFYNTIGCKVGSTQSDVVEQVFGIVGGKYGCIATPVSPTQSDLEEIIFGIEGGLFSGDMPIEFPGDYDSNALISIIHDWPLPITVSGIITLMSAYDR